MKINIIDKLRRSAILATLAFVYFGHAQAAESVTVTLHPGPSVTANQTRLVTIGLPLPKGMLAPGGSIQVTDAGGNEVAARHTPSLMWYDYPATTASSVRAMLIRAEVQFAPGEQTKTLRLNIDAPHGTPLAGTLPPVEASWVSIDSNPSALPNEYPASEGIREPAVYATLNKSWLERVNLRTQTRSIGEVSKLAWFDTAMVGFGRTAVNDVSPLVTEPNRINYANAAAPWLFDRALAIFNLYFRTGDVKWLRHGHRASQFYANHLSNTGYFDLKSFDDLKYSFAHSMLTDMVLTGDQRLMDKISHVASAGRSWPAVYRTNMNFWTERHHTYALLAALADWEISGSTAARQRLDEMVDGISDHILNPPSPLPADGCPIHQYDQHEGFNGDIPICSPWMTALLAEGISRYHNVTGDTQALVLLSRIGDFIDQYALFEPTNSNLSDYLLPYYLTSSQAGSTPEPGWGEWEHSCDVWGLALRGVDAKLRLNQPAQSLRSKLSRIEAGCESVIDNWHRPGL